MKFGKQKPTQQIVEMEDRLSKKFDGLIDLIGIFSEQIDGLEKKITDLDCLLGISRSEGVISRQADTAITSLTRRIASLEAHVPLAEACPSKEQLAEIEKEKEKIINSEAIRPLGDSPLRKV